VVKRPIQVRAWLVGWALLVGPPLLSVVVGGLLPGIDLKLRLGLVGWPLLLLSVTASSSTVLVLLVLLVVRSLRPGVDRIREGGAIALIASVLLCLFPLISDIGPFSWIKGFLFPYLPHALVGAVCIGFVLFERGSGSARFLEGRRLAAGWVLACGLWLVISGTAVGWSVAFLHAPHASFRSEVLIHTAVQLVALLLTCVAVFSIERRPHPAPVVIAMLPLIGLAGFAWHGLTWHRFATRFEAIVASRPGNFVLPEQSTRCVEVGVPSREVGPDCASHGVNIRSLPGDAPIERLRDGDMLLVRWGLIELLLPVTRTHGYHVGWNDGWVVNGDPRGSVHGDAPTLRAGSALPDR